MCGLDADRPLQHEPLRLAHRDRPAAKDVAHDLLGALAGILRDLGHEPDAQRDLGVEPLAGHEVPACRAPDLREDERRDDRRDDPEPDLGEPEDRVRPRDRDVRAGHEARPAAEREAVDAAHDRRRAGVDRLEHPVQPHRVLDVLVVGEVDRGSLPLDVGSSAERGAFALEQDGARVSDVAERLGELRDQGGVERVPPLGLREHDAKDMSLASDLSAGTETVWSVPRRFQ